MPRRRQQARRYDGVVDNIYNIFNEDNRSFDVKKSNIQSLEKYLNPKTIKTDRKSSNKNMIQLRKELTDKKLSPFGSKSELINRLYGKKSKAKTIKTDRKSSNKNMIQLRKELRNKKLSPFGLKTELINRLNRKKSNRKKSNQKKSKEKKTRVKTRVKRN